MSDEIVVKNNSDIDIYNLFDDGSDAPEIKQLPFINILHQAQLFEFPDGKTCKEFDGIILHSYESNLWWARSFDETGGGQLPDCFAIERKKGQKMIPDPACNDPQHINCYGCPQNQFGSNGAGKACKNRRNCFVLVKGYFCPLWMQVSATSLKEYDKYFDCFPVKRIKYQQVVTHFKLEKKDTYSLLKLSQMGEPSIDIDSLKELKAMIDRYMPLMYLNIVNMPYENGTDS